MSKSPAATPSGISEIDALTKVYANARTMLSDRVTALDNELREVRNRHLKGIKFAAGVAMQRKEELVAGITAAPHLFVQPRTFTLHGIQVGYKKGAGKITWDIEDEVLVARIEKQFSTEEADLLIARTKKPIKDALKALDAKALARLGCEVEGTTDYVYVKGKDSDIDKLVLAILKEGEAEKVDA